MLLSLREQIEANEEEQRRINGGEEGEREEREVMDAAACLLHLVRTRAVRL